MKKLAIAMILCLNAAYGFSQCRTEHVSQHQEIQTSEAVVLGTVTGAQPVPEAWDFLDGVNYTVRVDAKLHGKVHSTEVTVFSENSPAFFPMYVGQQYVLYLQPKWGRNQVDNCGNSHPTTSEDTASTKQPRMKAVSGF